MSVRDILKRLMRIEWPIRAYAAEWRNPPTSNWIMIAIFLGLFLASYSSVLTNDYGFSDDYFDTVPGNSELVVEKRMVREGRPLYALVSKVILSEGRHVEDFKWGRLIGIIGIALLAFTMYRMLIRAGWNRSQSFCAGVILCTTLPFQVYASWATTNVFPFAALASSCAFLLADKVRERKDCRGKCLLAVGAIFMLVIGTSIYQMAAMFFWVVAGATMLKSDVKSSDVLRQFLWCGIVFIVSMLLAYVMYKVIHLSYSTGSSSRGELASDFAGKIEYFFEILPDILGFSFLSPYHFVFQPVGDLYAHTYSYRFEDNVIKIVISFVILWGLFMYFQGTVRERLWKCIVALSLIPLSMAPILIIEENTYSYRVLVAPASLVVVYAFFSFQGFARIPRSFSPSCAMVIGGVATISSLFLAAYHVRTYIVIPQVEEMQIMRFQLEHADLSKVEKIHVIRPISGSGGESLAPTMRWEFGYTSSELKYAAPGMVFHLLREMAPDHMDTPVSSALFHESGFIETSANQLVVDMTNLPARRQAYGWFRDGNPFRRHLVSQSTFDVYVDDLYIYYAKEPCSQKDYETRFFLHVIPTNPKDLPEHRRQHGFDNYDFDFQQSAPFARRQYGFVFDGKCMAVVPRPRYADARIVTGQFSGEKRHWQTEFGIGIVGADGALSSGGTDG